VALLAALLAVAACGSAPEPEPVPDADGLPFASDSPWNLPIPGDPVLDGDSEEIAAALGQDGGATALLYDFGVPIYEATADTPLVAVTCTRDWGECPVEGEEVPIPVDAQSAPGEDGALVVIDRRAGRVYDFWQAQELNSGQWSVSWGTYADYDGYGISEDEGVNGGSTGAGINLLAGVVRLQEIRDGKIPHALSIASRLSCADEFRYPATKTDGDVDEGTCVLQGARLQLDPSIDVRSIPGITSGEVAVAEALQIHGGYVRDVSASTLAVAFEAPQEGEENPYPEAAGFPWDYYDMPNIPWDRLRVLQQWDGQ
jgi:hypothetical protein